VKTDAATGEAQYVAFGTNLSYIAGNKADSGLTEEQFELLKSGDAGTEAGAFGLAAGTSGTAALNQGRQCGL
jgi:hypothetical protein